MSLCPKIPRSRNRQAVERAMLLPQTAQEEKTWNLIHDTKVSSSSSWSLNQMRMWSPLVPTPMPLKWNREETLQEKTWRARSLVNHSRKDFKADANCLWSCKKISQVTWTMNPEWAGSRQWLKETQSWHDNAGILSYYQLQHSFHLYKIQSIIILQI